MLSILWIRSIYYNLLITAQNHTFKMYNQAFFFDKGDKDRKFSTIGDKHKQNCQLIQLPINAEDSWLGNRTT